MVRLAVGLGEEGRARRRPTTRRATCGCASTDGLRQFGVRLAGDPELQRKIDDWLERTLAYVVDNYKGEVGDLIATTVERWDSRDTSRRIELQVGHDLQFIRINGTVVGGIAGVLIYTVGQLLF